VSENPYEAPSESTPPLVLSGQPTVSPYGPYRETKGLAWSVVISLAITGIISGAQIFTFSSLIDANSRLYDDPDAVADINKWADATDTLTYAELLVFIVTVVLWCVWKNLSCKNAWLFRSKSGLANPMSSGDVFTPGWAVGWYFIPIAHLWKPFQAMSFIRNQVSDTFQGGAILGIWWTTWIIMNFASRALSRDIGGDTIEEINAFNERMMIDCGITIVAIIPAALVILSITKAQYRKHQALESIQATT
jgi:hypothetical protein